MKDIQEGKSTLNAVLHVGTNVIFKKSYVEDILLIQLPRIWPSD